MDRQAISRRQLLEIAGIGFGSMSLLLPYKSFANEETQSLAPIFRATIPLAMRGASGWNMIRRRRWWTYY